MNNDQRVQHWQRIYTEKQPEEVSWTQIRPDTSINSIEWFGVPKDAAIIDIGGGDSRLVDFLLQLGYTNLTVLDISAAALDRAKARLGEDTAKVKWIVSDILDFSPTEQYAVWHDRAAFHFLTEPMGIQRYAALVKQAVNGYLIIGTFSENGPLKCSGLPISQYSESTMTHVFEAGFTKMKCFTEDHTTPFNTTQNFLFCSFKSKEPE
ncbi:class I SAM-dependent methyltransferase [Pseudoflavitalea sp. G-6-1-2]|uniref:class I SAM-dependent methyltransferase n=1 Tax=Pseudoflavitalea sp. G-6-1-2 TaxID=2728841 RepID=UPI00146F5DF6|nr:class I SAM-dependent methyltransferase [Pseudoflavitalea sp. G-6-1-2]NML22071.1 class I SAM-dependent methyltransferase [Pseudoflavitalea sp. G-6-1-2]